MTHAAALIDMSPALEALAQAFWPGALTIVAPLRPGTGVSPLVTAGLPTLAVRVPDHPTARALLTATDRPVAAPSANRSGRISTTSADHVLAGLDGRIAAVLDSGPCTVGLESTIIGANGENVLLLRPGGLPVEPMEAAISAPIRPSGSNQITAPGQMLSHYAPNAALRLNATDIAPDEAALTFGATPDHPHHRNLSATGDLHEAAANLFGHLHTLDALVHTHALRGIAAMPVPDHGLGRAINDRLIRAAAPKDQSSV